MSHILTANAFKPSSENLPPVDQTDLQNFAKIVAQFAPHDGHFNLSVPHVRVMRSSQVTEARVHALSYPAICIVAQGAKTAYLSGESFPYDAHHMCVYAAEVPVTSQIIQASPETPYLCLILELNPHKLAELVQKVFPNGLSKTVASHPIYVGEVNPKILQSAHRLLQIILQQEESDLLAPLMVEEILIRLLRSPVGQAIAQIGLTDSYAQKISRATTWLKNNYTESIKVDHLAKLAGMSTSSFHQHFKEITLMSPLQFQKTLRLQEARNLMVGKMMDVSTASLEVGYSSVSQFSREYARHFGRSPKNDLSYLRERAIEAT